MRLKLGISLALIRPFKVLLMDEPTSALDPDGVDLFLEKLLMLRDNGKAILLTSHDLSTGGKIGWEGMADGTRSLEDRLI